MFVVNLDRIEKLTAALTIPFGVLQTEQMQKIGDLCGFPDETTWPGVSKLPFYKTLKPDRPTKRRVKDVFKS